MIFSIWRTKIPKLQPPRQLETRDNLLALTAHDAQFWLWARIRCETIRKFRRSLTRLMLFVATLAGLRNTSCLAADYAGELLPGGFLGTRGSQIVGPDGVPTRIVSVGLTGMNVVGGRLELAGLFKGIAGHVSAMRSAGFNCVRVDWINRTLDDPGAMAQLDAFVAACTHVGLKVIFDNHNNEATPADWENAAQQSLGTDAARLPERESAGRTKVHREPAAHQWRLVGLGLLNRAKPEWLRRGGRPDSVRASTLHTPDVVPSRRWKRALKVNTPLSQCSTSLPSAAG